MRRTFGLVVVAAMLMTAGSSALAYGGHGHGRGRGPGGPGMGRGDVLRQLDLTDEQKAQLEALREQHRDAMKPLFDEAEAARAALEALSTNEAATLADADAADQRMADAHLAIRRAKRAHHQEALALLTPAQVSKVPVWWRLALRPDGAGFGGGKGRHGHGRGPGFGPGCPGAASGDTAPQPPVDEE